ncbi:hypothetical protein [Caulobacter sp. RL271]|uniref:Flippase-like domain-containing protein n=1 Tax=Caulobacter segnis TaxID=88688 RepID=A0ABY4ZML4_9CAUL|nr:hypothetical protein [Caulobacter segnis]USQ93920.1 hypothetical protein MZV50_14985 [Caulobacter segnis]
MGQDTAGQETLKPADPKRSRLWGWLGAALSAGLVAAIVLQLGDATSTVLRTISRLPPLAWPALVLLYLTQPLFDFAVFRRLWNMPLAGFEALLRKNVINEVVLGYSGEAFLYVWARRAAGVVAAPFAAIKDANIVSALLGNLLTLVLAAVSATQLRDLDFAQRMGPALWSGLIPLAISVGVLAFGRRVFSLRLAELIHVGVVCGLRLIFWTVLTVLIWRMALPDVSTGQWIVLLAIRCLVSRIPLISNKDLVFGNLMLLLLGAHSTVAALMAALALVTLVLHLGVIVGLGAVDLARGWWRASPRGRAIQTAAETGGHD